MRIVKLNTFNFRVDDSILTGEADHKQKNSKPLDCGSTMPMIADKINLVFSGTLITIGSAICVVTQTGKSFLLYT